MSGPGYHQGCEEWSQMADARHTRPEVVEEVRRLHHEWLLDSEIAERLGLERLVVWHIRQFHHINRHRP